MSKQNSKLIEQPSTKPAKKKYPLIIFAVIILALALCYNFYAQHQKNLAMSHYYQDFIPNGATVENIADNAVKVLDANQNLIGYAGLNTYNGFGGPMTVGLLTDPEGNIENIEILEHRDTPSYLDRIEKEGFYTQYDNKNIKDGTAFQVDIDAISGATFSTRAIATNVDEIAESIRVNGLGEAPTTSTVPWQFGLAELAIAAIIAACVVLANVKKLRKFRPVLLIASVAAIGFWLNRPVTLAHISSVFMGYFPAFKTNLIWYAMLAIALLPPIITGKNYYCTYVCPFGAVQEGLHFVGKHCSIQLPGKQKFLHKTRNLIVFVALLVAFLLQNPSVSSFEPFATLFNQDITGIQLMLLIAVLVAAFFFGKFWCAGFCPVGGFLDILASLRRKITKKHIAKDGIPATSTPSCPHQAQTLTKKEKLAEGLYKVFYVVIIFSVVAAIFEKWAVL